MKQKDYQEMKRINRNGKLLGLALVLSIGSGAIGAIIDSKLLTDTAIGATYGITFASAYQLHKSNDWYSRVNKH